MKKMTTFELTPAQKEKEKALRARRIDTKVQMLRDAGMRRDALAFSINQLSDLDSTIYDVLFSDPVDAFVFLPLNTSPADGRTEYKYHMLSPFGIANTVADGATDRNAAEADMTETAVPIFEGGSSYTYTIGDAARSNGILDFDYVQVKARYAAEMVARWHNQMALFGGANIPGGPAAVTGFLNNASITPTTLTDEDWATAPTGLVMHNSIRDLIQAVNTQSDGVHSATDVLLSTAIWNLVQGTILDSAGSSQTVLTALRSNFPEITFRKSQTLAGKGAGGDDRCVAYQRSAQNVEYVASVVYDEASPDKVGFRFSIQTRGRAAGCVFRRPLSVAYGDIAV